MPGNYKVLFSDSSFNSYTITRVHSPEWYDDTVFSQAKIVTVTSGRTITGINAALSENLKALRKPEILGNPYLKGKVRATPGSLVDGAPARPTSYEWLLGDTVVGTGSTLEVPGPPRTSGSRCGSPPATVVTTARRSPRPR